MTDLVSVNGRISAASEAAISPLDRGFLYGDSVYETLRTYGGRPFRLDAHLDRLRRSAEALEIDHARAPVDPRAEVLRLIGHAAHPESAVRLILTRGTGPLGYDPSACGPPTLVVHARPCPVIPEAWRREGVDVAVVPVVRNAVPALDPAIKSSNLLNNFLAWSAGRRLGVYEPILLNPEGLVAEGASSNLFVVEAGRLLTPATAAGLLRGITRDVVLEIAGREGIDARETDLRPDDLRRADEAFLTSTLKGVLPIRRIDGWPVREGRPGPLTRRLMERFEALAQAETNAPAESRSIRR